jgi:hypothetical protein
MTSLEEQRRQAKRGNAVLTYKEVNRTLSSAERQLLHGLQRKLGSINAKLNGPRRAKAAAKAARFKQGPAGGVTRVVSGGAPGSVKRA